MAANDKESEEPSRAETLNDFEESNLDDVQGVSESAETEPEAEAETDEGPEEEAFPGICESKEKIIEQMINKEIEKEIKEERQIEREIEKEIIERMTNEEEEEARPSDAKCEVTKVIFKKFIGSDFGVDKITIFVSLQKDTRL